MDTFSVLGTKLSSGFDATLEAGKDQLQQHMAAASGASLPVTYHPFKFENRRLRIDWRLLHGVDITKVIRDTDLDTLERLVSCITWGDIEAEDTRHLSEANFVKIFRLAQLLLEYLLYVQDNLKYTNNVLEQSRTAALVHVQSVTARCNELQGQLKLCKKELRSTRKTVKTLELMAAAVQTGTLPPSTAAGVNLSVNTESTWQDQHGQQQQDPPMQQTMQQTLQQQQHQTFGVFDMSSAEVLLQGQLAELTERMAVAGCELERLREEREELQYQVRYMYDMLAAKTGGDKSSQRHFSPVRSSMYASRAAGSPHSWRREYGDTYETAAAAEAEAAAASAAAAAAEEEIARRTAALQQQHLQETQQLRLQLDQQVQEHQSELQQHDNQLQRNQQQLQQIEQELQQREQELHRCQQQIQQYDDRVQQLEVQLQEYTTQLEQLQDENADLRDKLSEAAAAPRSGDNDALIASLREQLNDKIRECTYLQGEVNQRDTSIATFKQANELLERELEKIQQEKLSPDATTPSFVAKQRKSIAMAETKADKLQQQVTELMQENIDLAQQVAQLRAGLAAGGGAGPDNAVAAAEQLLLARDSISSTSKGPVGSAAAEKAWQQVEELKQERLALVEQVDDMRARLAAYASASPQERDEKGTEWKLQEIERLQDENRLLQHKVTSLQQQCADLERINTQLERQVVKAHNLGLAASLEASATSTPASNLAAAIAAAGGSNPSSRNSWARASVNSAASAASSGPRAEITAADLAAGGMTVAGGLEGQQQQHLEDDSAAGSEAEGPAGVRAIAVRPAAGQQADAAAVVFRGPAPAGKPDSSWIKQPAGDEQESASAKGMIAAYRPEQYQPAQQPPQLQQQAATTARPASAGASAAGATNSSSPTAGGGQISLEAAAQLKEYMSELANLASEQVEGEYREMCDDWDLPFDLKPEEREWFQQHLLPYEVPGRAGLLTATPHSVDEFAANQARLLDQINKQVDTQLASYGIHPGRIGLSKVEFMAAMRMLSERRAAWESQLTPEQKQHVDAARCGLLLHPYNISQGVLQQQPDGPDGKKHFPEVDRPLLVSAVRPPASMLPAGPAAIKVFAVSPQAGAAPQANPSAHATASISPTASNRHQSGSQFDRDSKTGSPQHQTNPTGPQAAAPEGFSPMSAALHRKHSPRGPAPGQSAADAAAAAGRLSTADSTQGASPRQLSRFAVGGSGGSYTAGPAVAAAGSVAGGVAPAVAAYRGGPGVGGSPGGSPQKQVQQGRSVSPGIAAAMRQYAENSFDESDEF